MDVNIKIVIGIGSVFLIVFGGPPILDEFNSWLLVLQGKCPNVAVNGKIDQQYTETGWFGGKVCKVYLQTEVKNSGKNTADNVEIYCSLEGSNGTTLNSEWEKFGDLRPGDRRVVEMDLDYSCEYTYDHFMCNASYDDPCR